MNFKFALPALALAAAAGFTAPANAVIPVYPAVGTPNPANYNFALAGSGNLGFYWLGGETVSYRALFSYSVNGGAFTTVFDTFAAPIGSQFNLGSFNAGDEFEFRLTLTKPLAVAGFVVSTDKSVNDGGLQQVYLASYSGGDLGVPVGSYSYLAFEDILGLHDGNRKGDFDYNDQRFAFYLGQTPTVFQGVVPEPATWAMLISGFGMVGFAMRRRKSSLSVVSA